MLSYDLLIKISDGKNISKKNVFNPLIFKMRNGVLLTFHSFLKYVCFHSGIVCEDLIEEAKVRIYQELNVVILRRRLHLTLY